MTRAVWVVVAWLSMLGFALSAQHFNRVLHGEFRGAVVFICGCLGAVAFFAAMVNW